MDDSVILEARKLRKEFGGLIAVNDVDIKIRAGTFHSIIGPNGAGKTTLFNLLSRTLDPTTGHVLFKGHDITHIPVQRIAHLGIGRSFQITNIFPNLTAFENIRLACQAVGRDNFKMLNLASDFKAYEEKSWQVIRQVGLSERAMMVARSLPHGDQRKLELGMILAENPEVLLLDEPTAGMAGEQVPEFMALIKQVQRDGGKTIVLVEHNMSVVMNASEKITVMHQGAILAEGTPTEIAANKEVQSAYLGGMQW
jgi:branched-chain amino acid transport system ATP-binding protein